MKDVAFNDFEVCLVFLALSTLLWENNRKFLSIPMFSVGLLHFIIGLGKFTGNV